MLYAKTNNCACALDVISNMMRCKRLDPGQQWGQQSHKVYCLNKTSAEQQIALWHHHWGTGTGALLSPSRVWMQICWFLLSGHRLRRSTQRCDTRQHSSCTESPNKNPFTSDARLNLVPYKDVVSRARDLIKLLADIFTTIYYSSKGVAL